MTRIASFWCLYCELWTYFTPCSSVFTVNFKHVITGWNCFFAVKVFANNSSETSVWGRPSTKKKIRKLLRIPFVVFFSKFANRRRASFLKKVSGSSREISVQKSSGCLWVASCYMSWKTWLNVILYGVVVEVTHLTYIFGFVLAERKQTTQLENQQIYYWQKLWVVRNKEFILEQPFYES